jgi:hypothetical protein
MGQEYRYRYDLLKCGIFMHKEEKNDGKKIGFDLLFGVVSWPAFGRWFHTYRRRE